eukprot:7383811-Prymnesium_polylepis.1
MTASTDWQAVEVVALLHLVRSVALDDRALLRGVPRALRAEQRVVVGVSGRLTSGGCSLDLLRIEAEHAHDVCTILIDALEQHLVGPQRAEADATIVKQQLRIFPSKWCSDAAHLACCSM